MLICCWEVGKEILGGFFFRGLFFMHFWYDWKEIEEDVMKWGGVCLGTLFCF